MSSLKVQFQQAYNTRDLLGVVLLACKANGRRTTVGIIEWGCTDIQEGILTMQRLLGRSRLLRRLILMQHL